MAKDYIDFYSYDGTLGYDGGIGIAKNNDNVVEAVKDALADRISFRPNGEKLDILIDGQVVSEVKVPDEAAYESATYDPTTKSITFGYDQDGVEGTHTLDLSDLSDKYEGENGIVVDGDKVSVKYDEKTLKINDKGELEGVSDNVWGEI